MRLHILGVALLGTACMSSVSPHDNFNAHMQNNVGKALDDPTTNWIRPEVLVATKELANGNFENEYRFRGTCRYFFEYERQSRRIVAWRSEGNAQDCAIVP